MSLKNDEVSELEFLRRKVKMLEVKLEMKESYDNYYQKSDQVTLGKHS